MDWSGFAELNTRSQIVQNGVGDEICTLKEQKHKTSPLTIGKQDGSIVLVNSYRTIDFPLELHKPSSGTMHLSLVAKDKDGNAPSINKAVYFTAHYEATPKPNGVPKLKEVSSPQPIKFLGREAEAIGYIEHGRDIYTLQVTRGKYEEMMKEVARNKGQAVDLSLEVERKTQDLINNIEKVSGAEITRNKKILEEHIEPGLNKCDKEREKILLLTKKCLTDPKYKEFEPYIRKTAEQHIELHHQVYLAEADEGKALKELTEIMKNIGYKGFEAAVGRIKEVLIEGGKLGFNVVLESLKQGGFENYVKQQSMNQSKKVGSYVAHCITERIRATLSGKVQNSTNSAPIKPGMIGIN